jgi:hypothetical protein
LNEILPEKKRPSVQQPNEEQDNPDGVPPVQEEEEKLNSGEIPSKEYDYLLTM